MVWRRRIRWLRRALAGLGRELVLDGRELRADLAFEPPQRRPVRLGLQALRPVGPQAAKLLQDAAQMLARQSNKACIPPKRVDTL